MLTTARAIMFAAFLISLAVLAHAVLPRYEIRVMDANAGIFLRVDRWRGSVEVGFTRADVRPPWLSGPAAPPTK